MAGERGGLLKTKVRDNQLRLGDIVMHSSWGYAQKGEGSVAQPHVQFALDLKRKLMQPCLNLFDMPVTKPNEISRSLMMMNATRLAKSPPLPMSDQLWLDWGQDANEIVTNKKDPLV